jgi:hypothetical protein
VKVDPFMPAVLGSKTIGNFTTQAFPGAGAYLFGAFVVGVLGLAAFHLIAGRRQATRVYTAGVASANA